MSRLESVFKLTPRNGEFILKVSLLVYYFLFVIKRNDEYISGTLLVCRSSVRLSVHVVKFKCRDHLETLICVGRCGSGFIVCRYIVIYLAW